MVGRRLVPGRARPMSKVCGVTRNVTDLTARGFDRGKPGLPDRFGAGRSQPKGGRSRFAARQARVTKGVEGKSPIRWNTIDGYRTTTRKPMVENIADIRWRWTARRSAAKCWIASSPAGARQRLSLLALRLANGIAHLYWAAVEVVDAQLHLNLLGADATGLPDGQLTQRALVIMDAVGVDRRDWHNTTYTRGSFTHRSCATKVQPIAARGGGRAASFCLGWSRRLRRS